MNFPVTFSVFAVCIQTVNKKTDFNKKKCSCKNVHDVL